MCIVYVPICLGYNIFRFSSFPLFTRTADAKKEPLLKLTQTDTIEELYA